MDRARCAGRDQFGEPLWKLFFRSDKLSEDLAKQVCRGCEVRGECLEWGVRTNMYGVVFGGLSEQDRYNAYRRDYLDRKREAGGGNIPIAQRRTVRYDIENLRRAAGL